MSLKKQEQKLLKKIEELGLVREIKHIRHKPCTVTYGSRSCKNVQAETIAYLVNPNKNDNQFRKILDAYGCGVKVIKYKHLIESWGFSVCHKNDQFNKRLGRVIATGRALKKYEDS
ncbi:hypothetical protein AKJ51_04205 [candidate division MSBL1 archaeon SCGC-AAA382A20]|uniref:Uncharacterized protein n=1 Tax=candidate division MSBL1 archaeon SCGC-AAA382A20 TaxID=1698280 RepID=A0A133VI65_9EURY|nr:hypothetical protein AKJ51_04205 [candidate division MSBL1 archaeon SCGC-AAA382A20]